MKLREAVDIMPYARRLVTPEDILNWPPSATTLSPMSARWVATSRALVDSWGRPGQQERINEFWYADGRMEHLRYLENSEWRLVNSREDWEPFDFFKYIVTFRWVDPRGLVTYEPAIKMPRWLLG